MDILDVVKSSALLFGNISLFSLEENGKRPFFINDFTSSIGLHADAIVVETWWL